MRADLPLPGLAKGFNVIESLWAGRFVVAHPIPSYIEFKTGHGQALTWRKKSDDAKRL
jgi:hypothetical protein